ncbi:NERD domain-containing protein [Nocardia sp. NPDC001965]
MMLVIANKPKSGTESRVFEWLKGWTGQFKIPGIAITNAYVAGQEVDLIIITPHTTVAVEIKGTAPGVPGDGVLICTSNSRWQVPGYVGDPVHVRVNDTTPYDQARDSALKLKRVVSRVGSGVYVPGLVVVVPPRNSTMRLDKRSAPDGCAVLLCENHSPLRAWFHRAHRSGSIAWTAEQAYALVDALECGDRITVAELAAEGFPRRQAAPSPAASPTMPRSSPARPEPPVLAKALAPRPPASPKPTRPTETAPRQVMARQSTPASASRRSVYQTTAAFAAIAVLGGGLWLLAQPDGESDPKPIGNEQPISSVIGEPVHPPLPTPTEEFPPAPAPADNSCFPFQSNC